MKLSELITKIGDDNVKIQSLDVSTDALNYDAKKGTKITFGSTASVDFANNRTRELGLVVWLDRDTVDKILGDQQ